MKFTIAIALIGALLVSTTATSDDALKKLRPQLRRAALKKDRVSSMSLPELTKRKLLCLHLIDSY